MIIETFAVKAYQHSQLGGEDPKVFGLKSHQIKAVTVIPYMRVYMITAGTSSVSKSTVRAIADLLLRLMK